MKHILKYFLVMAAAFVAAAAESDDFEIGVACHFAFGRGELERNLDMIKAAGVGIVRDEYNWSTVEQKKGEYRIGEDFLAYLRALEERNLLPQVVLCYANALYDDNGYPVSPEAVEAYTKYAEYVLSHLSARPRIVEIWNEWDGGCGMDPAKGKGKLEDYINLLKAVYPRLKAIDPDCIVLGGSFCSTGLLQQALEMGLAENCDAVSLHTYNYEEVFSAAAPEEWYRRMLRVTENFKKRYGIPVFISEMGYPSHIGPKSVTEEAQADRLARLFLLGSTIEDIVNVTWYDFQCDGDKYDSSEDNFGIVKTDLTPKAAYFVLSDVAEFLKSARFEGFECRNEDGLWVLRYKIGDEDAIVAWSELDDARIQIIFHATGIERVNMRHFGRMDFERRWGFYDWVDARDAGIQQEKFSVTVGNMPLVIRGKGLADAEIDRVVHRPWDERLRFKVDRLKLPGGGIIATAQDAPERVYHRNQASDYTRVTTDWQGARDLSFAFSVSYRKDKMIWKINVEDDVFSQNFRDGETWNADGIQFAIQTHPNSGEDDRTEFDLALVDGRAQVFLRSNRINAPNEITTLIPARVKRNGSCTSYEFEISADLLKVPAFESGQMYTATFLVNDADADPLVRRGYIRWGDGIGTGRNCNLYQLIYLD